MTRKSTLRWQIVASFFSFAAAVSLLFAASSFIVAYVVEDAFFEETIREEVARQKAHRAISEEPLPPLRDYITIYTDIGSLPADLKEAFAPTGKMGEYTGTGGRHYHVLPFALPDGRQAVAVAEVSSRLVVRPLRGELLVLVVAGALGIFFLAAALGYWLATRATAPLSRLVSAVSTMDQGQVPKINASDYPPNEVGTLACTLEEMLDRTRAFVERESRFTRDASHELRTPLAIIKSSVELLEAKGELPQATRKPLERISDAVRQMTQSVELLLLLAREERAQSPSEDVLLLPLVERVIVSESTRCGAQAFDVAVSIPIDCRIRINEAVASTIISNLIGNAFTHNQAATALRVAVEGADLVIRDTGQGIPAQVLAELGGGPSGAVPAGRGLGLSIVTRLCNVHDIPFHIESSPQGTVIRLRLLRTGELIGNG